MLDIRQKYSFRIYVLFLLLLSRQSFRTIHLLSQSRVHIFCVPKNKHRPRRTPLHAKTNKYVNLVAHFFAFPAQNQQNHDYFHELYTNSKSEVEETLERIKAQPGVEG